MLDPAGDKLAAATQHIDAMQAQVDRLAAYIGSYATAASVLITILALIITIALAVSTYFAFAVSRNNRLAKALTSSIDDLDNKRRELEVAFNIRIEQLEKRIGSYHQGLMGEVIARSGLMRELIAGELCYRRSDYIGALDHFSRVHGIEPENVDAAYFLGRTLTNLNKLDDAISVYDELLLSDPQNVKASRGLALALRFKDPKRARRVALSALAHSNIPPEIAHDINNEYALILRDSDEYQAALRHHVTALSFKPGDTATEYFIGIAEMLCQRTDRGRSRLMSARERARIELDDRTLRPLWAAVIGWSAAFVEGDDKMAGEQIQSIKSNLDSTYLAFTVQSHLDALAKITGKIVPQVL